MEDKILGFQFELVSAKPTHPSYNDGSDQDEPQKQPPEVFCKKCALRNFTKLTVKYLCQSFFLKKLYLQNISRRLLPEPDIQHNRLSSQEWRKYQNCEKMPTRLECVCCHKILKVKVFNLKSKIRLSRNITDLEFTEAAIRRCFPK